MNRPRVPVLSYDRNATTVHTSVPIGRGGTIVLENAGKASPHRGPGHLRRLRTSGPARRPQPGPAEDTHAPSSTPRSNLQVRLLGAGTHKDFSVGDAVPRGCRGGPPAGDRVRRARQGGTLTFWRAGDRTAQHRRPVRRAGAAPSPGPVLTSLADGRKVRVNNSGIERGDVRITVLGSFQWPRSTCTAPSADSSGCRPAHLDSGQ